MDLAFPVAGALLVPWTRSSTGRRTFAVYGPEPGIDHPWFFEDAGLSSLQ